MINNENGPSNIPTSAELLFTRLGNSRQKHLALKVCLPSNPWDTFHLIKLNYFFVSLQIILQSMWWHKVERENKKMFEIKDICILFKRIFLTGITNLGLALSPKLNAYFDVRARSHCIRTIRSLNVKFKLDARSSHMFSIGTELMLSDCSV